MHVKLEGKVSPGPWQTETQGDTGQTSSAEMEVKSKEESRSTSIVLSQVDWALGMSRVTLVV